MTIKFNDEAACRMIDRQRWLDMGAADKGAAIVAELMSHDYMITDEVVNGKTIIVVSGACSCPLTAELGILFQYDSAAYVGRSDYASMPLQYLVYKDTPGDAFEIAALIEGALVGFSVVTHRMAGRDESNGWMR